jgi:hypothetical protein
LKSNEKRKEEIKGEDVGREVEKVRKRVEAQVFNCSFIEACT